MLKVAWERLIRALFASSNKRYGAGDKASRSSLTVENLSTSRLFTRTKSYIASKRSQTSSQNRAELLAVDGWAGCASLLLASSQPRPVNMSACAPAAVCMLNIYIFITYLGAAPTPSYIAAEPLCRDERQEGWLERRTSCTKISACLMKRKRAT